MKTIKLKCTNCGADLTADDSREFIFCEYCGTKNMLVEDYTTRHTYVDQARVVEANVKERMHLSDQEMEKWEYEKNKQAAKEYREETKKTAMLVALGLVVSIVLMILAESTGIKGLGAGGLFGILGCSFYFIMRVMAIDEIRNGRRK